MVAGMAGYFSKSMALSAMPGVVRAVFLAGLHAGEVNLNWNLTPNSPEPHSFSGWQGLWVAFFVLIKRETGR